jgi:peptidoglycan/xylan/chitin deacetylase (PgdA/CDA1 family)
MEKKVNIQMAYSRQIWIQSNIQYRLRQCGRRNTKRQRNTMNWEEIISLHQAGHEIGSHTMNHEDLSKLSEQALEFEVGQSRQCLLDRGIDVTSFSYPFNGGDDNETVMNTVAKYYERARTATGPLMHLNCNGV